MKVVLFTHPDFLGSKSMPRFAKMISEYLDKNLIECEIWSPKSLFYKLVPNHRFSKWLGYIDQYVIFPIVVKFRLFNIRKDVLYVFCDQALGPWVPLVSDRPHVIHCHDFMALRSALGLHPENPTGFSGRIYQKYIQQGFSKGKNFISISNRTREDLHKYNDIRAVNSLVVYNGLNYNYKKKNKTEALEVLLDAGILTDDSGCLLHVGAGQWYKNTLGIIKIYSGYCKKIKNAKPLILVSPSPRGALRDEVNKLPANAKIKFVQGLEIKMLEALYSYADVFLFPSIAEGFGWPIIEAQACGCPVITTDDAPMNEIGGPITKYLPKLGAYQEEQWVDEATTHIINLISMSKEEKELFASKAILWSENFNSEKKLAEYLDIYKSILSSGW